MGCSKWLKISLVGSVALAAMAVCLLPIPAGRAAPAVVEVLHSYQTSTAWEIVQTVAVSASKLTPLLPVGYHLVPAAALGLGGSDQGIVALANYRGRDPRVDGRQPDRPTQVAIDEIVLVTPPPGAAAAGVDLPGAYNFYTLGIIRNDPRYSATLQEAGMPVKFEQDVTYDRRFDDAAGFGTLTVAAPAREPLVHSTSVAFGYRPAGALDVVFWYEGPKGTAVLHFHDEPFEQGQALADVYTHARTPLNGLLAGGGLGPCAPDAATGDACVVAPALNFRYPGGSRNELLLMRQTRAS